MKIVLYQIIPELDTANLLFMSLDYIRKSCGDKVPADIYEAVYIGNVEADNLEDVWRIFNKDFPPHYRGRSMSVSDVVEVIGRNGKSKFFFCDSIGFKRVKFNKKKSMALVLNHNFDYVREKRENVSVFFMNKSEPVQIKCKEMEFARCKYSKALLGYRLLCKSTDGNVLKYDFSERPSVIVSKCMEDIPKELLHTEDATSGDKDYLGIICTWLAKNGYEAENLYGGCIT